MIELMKQEYDAAAPENALMITPEGVQAIINSTAEQAAGLIVSQMTQQMAAMAEMMRITNERMAELEKSVRTLEKVTPQQIGAINKAIRERAKELCEDYLVDGGEKMVAAGIRKEVRKMTGAQTTREICRCDAGTVARFIQEWDDPEEMRKIRKKVSA